MDPRCSDGCILENRDNNRDQNERMIILALRELGASVRRLDATLGGDMAGIPDLLVGLDGRNYLLEVKTARGSLNDNQKVFHDSWLGEVYVVRSVEDVRRIVKPTWLEDTQPSKALLEIEAAD